MDPCKWLKANGVDLAPLTGQDRRALVAIASAWEVYAGDDDARKAAIAAVRALLGAMQPKCRPLTKMLIARALDWSDVEPLWAKVFQEMKGERFGAATRPLVEYEIVHLSVAKREDKR